MAVRKTALWALVAGGTLGLASWAALAAGGAKPEPLTYPKTKTVDQADDYHGVKIADPYRWLEDLDSPETAAWVKAENDVTFKYLEGIPARNKIKARITHLWNHERYGLPYKEGGRYFFTKNDGLQPQAVWYVTDKLDAEPRLLIDPNLLSTDGTVSLEGLFVREDGKLMVYALSTAGSDWAEFKVRDIDTGKDLADHLKWIKFSGASWTKDGQGFFYSRFDEPQGNQLETANYYQKLFYHRLGTPQSEDRLVYQRPDEKEWGINGGVTDDGKYLIITIHRGSEERNLLFYQELTGPAGQGGPIVELISQFEAKYNFIDNDGPLFWFETDRDAPRGRLIAIDTRHPQPESWKVLVPEVAETLEGANVVNDTLIATYLKDAHTVVRMFDLQGQHVRDVELPGIGTVDGFGGKRTYKETFYGFTGFGTPYLTFHYDMQTGQSTIFRQPKVDFDPAQYETKQVFYNSKDGTRIPMFITHKKGLKLDGNNPTFLYGYGGFNVSLTPRFSAARLVWLEMGGVYAVPNLRGGGEYGQAWHDAGRLHNKQNVFDDFIAAAEWLIANKYTRTEKLAISGASNGGTLIGACMTQRPELFGACLPGVGVMDMLRFHKYTIGWAWTSDYGSPDNPEDFKVLRAYSPLHNIKPGVCYPPTLVTTADHDDRVVPAHSFKFISALQAAQGCDNPVLIRIETKAGHGGGKPTQKIIEEISDEYAFLVRVLDMDATVLPETPLPADSSK